MLLNNFHLLQYDPISFLLLVGLTCLALVVAVTAHEFSHAIVASGLGDATARCQGRVSLNPLRHLDPAGSMLFLVAGFGWGKPVPVNEYRLSHGMRGVSLVAGAGPVSNLATAFLLAAPVKMGLVDIGTFSLSRIGDLKSGGPGEFLAAILALTILFNLLLGVFNLLPIAPLDGSRILAGFIPRNGLDAYERFQRFGPALLVGLVALDYLLHTGILWTIIGTPVNLLMYLAMGG